MNLHPGEADIRIEEDETGKAVLKVLSPGLWARVSLPLLREMLILRNNANDLRKVLEG